MIYNTVKNLSCFNPTLIHSNPKASQKRLKGLCDKLLDANRITTTNADRAVRAWEQLTVNENFRSSCKDFTCLLNDDPEKRLDIFYRCQLNGRDEYTDLYRVVKICLVLSHGNAEAERGFSVNKQLLQDNMLERSLIAQRLTPSNSQNRK